MAGVKLIWTIAGIIIFQFVSGLSGAEQFHDGMSPEELSKLFPFAENGIPEYEVVPIHKSKLQKRADGSGVDLQMAAFGQKYRFYLNPPDAWLASTMTPVMTVSPGMRFNLIPGVIEDVVKALFVEQSQAATVTINEYNNGNIAVDGIIGKKNLHIKSIPDNYKNNARRWGRSVHNISEHEIDNYTFHIVSILPAEPKYLKELKNPFHYLYDNSTRFKRSVPNVIYPEVMVIIDNALFQLMHKNIKTAVAYALALMSGVDFKYRTLSNPQWRINIAGIIIEENPGTLEYLRHRFPNNRLDVNAILVHGETWFYHLREQFNFDAAITMTAQGLSAVDNGQYKNGIIGYAHISMSCNPLRDPRRGNIMRNSGIVYDPFAFQGIITVAHELGHIFGIRHDGETLDHSHCHNQGGTIMTPSVSFRREGSDWSVCSKQDLSNFLRNPRDTWCLHNKPTGGKRIYSWLPGKLMDANAQCARRTSTEASRSTMNACVVLLCQDNRSGSFEAADGTRCAPNKICLQGHCVDDIVLTLARNPPNNHGYNQNNI